MNLVHMSNLQNNYLNDDDNLSSILAALNTPFIAEWGAIGGRKQQIIYLKNSNNNNRKPQSYKVRENLIVRDKNANKYENPYKVPYPITNVWKNGTIVIHWGAV